MIRRTLTTLVLLVSGAMMLTTLSIAAGARLTELSPSRQAKADIPPRLLGVYRRAARRCSGLRWTVLAAIGKVESDHARANEASVDDDLTAAPPILGPPLDGRDGRRRITDTDGGRVDRDPRLDRAVGPMQFLPATWRRWGVDANRDGRADPHNAADAAAAAADFLCAAGVGTSRTALRQALYAYNQSADYIRRVLAVTTAYESGRAALPADAPTVVLSIPALPGK